MRDNEGDIVLFPEFAADPEVAHVLADIPVQQESAESKDFSEPVPFLRIGARTLAEHRRRAR